MYDVLIKGARVIDPTQNIDGELDLAITRGRIAFLGKNILAQTSYDVVNAAGKLVTPGLIDLHCHVYDGFSKNAVAPDAAGVNQGVTIVVDGGSAGEANFGGFPKHIVPASVTTIFCFIYLGSLGVNIMSELKGWDDVKPDAIVATIESNRNLIRGIKVLLKGEFMAHNGLKAVKIAKEIAAQFKLPVMVHIGDPQKHVTSNLTQKMLTLLDSGDILTHVYTVKPGTLMRPDGSMMTELQQAKERGVILDTAVGKNNFCFTVARKAIAEGILPTTISTDLSAMSLNGPVYGLTVTMSRFMALGLDLKQVIEMTTANPARVIGIEDRAGCLKPGRDADVSVLEQLCGTWAVEDSEHQFVRMERLLTPFITIKSGKVVKPQIVSRPKVIQSGC